MPPGRRTVKTLLRGEEHRERVYEGIRRELGRGRQVFVIYPLVEEGSGTELKAAVAMAGRLERGPFAGFRVACIHGRMPRDRREETMLSFARGEVQVLVATTVVEVGIDVPNATVLVVEHPERFGLSQLHQLRGRVGRGKEKSYCILLASTELSEEARGRLDVLVNESDGFRIAERDMELRGPGDILGTRQHGVPALRVGNLVRDGALMGLARREARVWLERFTAGEAQPPPALAERLERRWRGRFDLVQVG
jgi:ATP-dependent DNA helicase RecG